MPVGSNAVAGASSVKRQNHGLSFAKVCDGRKQPIRGLWVRNGRFYAQLRIENPITGVKKTRRVLLVDADQVPVRSSAQAVAQMARLRTQRVDNALPVLARQPKFADYAVQYISAISGGQGAKSNSSIQKEKAILSRWTEAVGQLRLDQIKRVHVNRFIESRLKENVSPRTINLDVIALRVILKRAFSDGLIQRLPMEGLRPLKTIARKRPLFTSAELDRLCMAAFERRKSETSEDIPVTENAQEFVDYIRLMAYSGCRRNEALGLKWDDVDLDNGQLNVRRQVTSVGMQDLKNHEERTVDFNSKLKAHLLDMKARSRGVSQWLFPSPQRGKKDIPAKTFRESLELVRAQARMPQFGFHDCRHFFISMCVMSGIDYMTIAKWVGHRDGGVLIGKVYGHLSNEHAQRQAARLSFEQGASKTDNQ
jgi:integrase